MFSEETGSYTKAFIIFKGKHYILDAVTNCWGLDTLYRKMKELSNVNEKHWASFKEQLEELDGSLSALAEEIVSTDKYDEDVYKWYSQHFHRYNELPISEEAGDACEVAPPQTELTN